MRDEEEDDDDEELDFGGGPSGRADGPGAASARDANAALRYDDEYEVCGENR